MLTPGTQENLKATVQDMQNVLGAVQAKDFPPKQLDYVEQDEEDYPTAPLVLFDPKNYEGCFFPAEYSIPRTTAFAWYITDCGTCPLTLADDALQSKAGEAPDYVNGVLGAGHFTVAGQVRLNGKDVYWLQNSRQLDQEGGMHWGRPYVAFCP